MHLGSHHQSLRRRGLLFTPARSKKLIHRVDTLTYIVSMLSLLFTMDQVRIIWLNHNASGVSLLSWMFYTLSSVVWFFYGYIHKDKVLLITNFFWVAINVCVVLGVLMYG